MSERKEIAIDIGCGPKNNLNLYDSQLDQPTIALDSNLHFLNERRAIADGNLILADAHFLPIRSNVADKVFLTHVLEHVDEPSQTLAEVKRITHTGSRLGIAVPESTFESVMSLLDESYHGPTMHQRVFNIPTLKKTVESHGFKITNSKTRGFITALIITFMYFWHLKVKKDRKMEEQSGRLITDDEIGNNANEVITNSSRPSIKKARILYHSLENHPILGKLFFWNKIYPFENFLQATKR